jgi:predicted N-formylglutamate amidohydrolase
VIVTCEHGGNRIPSRYRAYFAGHERLLHTHSARDFGALRLAHDISSALDAPLVGSVISRLLVDLNRSQENRARFSEMTRHAPTSIKDEITEEYYFPYRREIQNRIERAIAGGFEVVHLSCHSFTPVLRDARRDADIGLLYDPARVKEAMLCRSWLSEFKSSGSTLKIRLNYPYKGTSDGLTSFLRRWTGNDDPTSPYVGVEIEVNQKHVFEGESHWHALRSTIVETLLKAMCNVYGQKYR